MDEFWCRLFSSGLNENYPCLGLNKRIAVVQVSSVYSALQDLTLCIFPADYTQRHGTMIDLQCDSGHRSPREIQTKGNMAYDQSEIDLRRNRTGGWSSQFENRHVSSHSSCRRMAGLLKFHHYRVNRSAPISDTQNKTNIIQGLETSRQRNLNIPSTPPWLRRPQNTSRLATSGTVRCEWQKFFCTKTNDRPRRGCTSLQSTSRDTPIILFRLKRLKQP